MLAFFTFLKAISAVFLYKVTDVSSTMVTNLDLTIEVVNQRLSVYPTLSKLPRPLCPTSAHAQRVHHAWPRAVKNRATSLSSIEHVHGSISKLLSNYRQAGAHPFTMAKLETEPARFKRCSAEQPGDHMRISCVYRYHPVFALALQRTLRFAEVPPTLRINLRTSWTNALPSLNSKLAAHNDKCYNAIKGSGASEQRSEEGIALCFCSQDKQPIRRSSTIVRNFTFSNCT